MSTKSLTAEEALIQVGGKMLVTADRDLTAARARIAELETLLNVARGEASMWQRDHALMMEKMQKQDAECAERSSREALRHAEAEIAKLAEALRQIAKGKGAFRRDPLEHATNVIEEAKACANAALAGSRRARERLGECNADNSVE